MLTFTINDVKINTIRTNDVSPTNFSISLDERKAVEDGVLVFNLQTQPRKLPFESVVVEWKKPSKVFVIDI